MEEEVEFDPIDRLLKKLTDHAVDHKSKIVSMNKEMTKEFVIVKKQLTQLTNVNTEMDERLKEMDERLTEMDKGLKEMDERFLGQFSEMDERFLGQFSEMDERFLGQFSEMGRKIDALADLLRKE